MAFSISPMPAGASTPAWATFGNLPQDSKLESVMFDLYIANKQRRRCSQMSCFWPKTSFCHPVGILVDSAPRPELGTVPSQPSRKALSGSLRDDMLEFPYRLLIQRRLCKSLGVQLHLRGILLLYALWPVRDVQ